MLDAKRKKETVAPGVIKQTAGFATDVVCAAATGALTIAPLFVPGGWVVPTFFGSELAKAALLPVARSTTRKAIGLQERSYGEKLGKNIIAATEAGASMYSLSSPQAWVGLMSKLKSIGAGFSAVCATKESIGGVAELAKGYLFTGSAKRVMGNRIS